MSPFSVHTPRRRYRFYTRVCARAVRKDYVAFLTRGMHVVYDDLFAADRIRVPASWQSALKGGRSIHALSISKCIEMIAEVRSRVVHRDASKQSAVAQTAERHNENARARSTLAKHTASTAARLTHFAAIASTRHPRSRAAAHEWQH